MKALVQLLKGLYNVRTTAVFALSVFLLTSCAAGTLGTRASLSKEEKESLLRERVTTLWNAVVNRDRGTVYDMFDPFYRAQLDRGVYMAQRSSVFHSNPEIRALDIQGNVAKVTVRVDYMVRGLKTPRGNEINEPLKESVMTEIWVFIDDNWYREYRSNIAEAGFLNF